MDRDKEIFQDNLQHEQRKGAGGPADEIVAVLGEAREKRERNRWKILSICRMLLGCISGNKVGGQVSYNFSCFI